MQLRLNPALDPAPFARTYAERKYVQVPDLFEPEIADQVEAALLSLNWRLVLQDDQEKNVLLTREQLAAMSPEERNRLSAAQQARAARNVGYSYLMYPMIGAWIERWDPGHPIHKLTEFLNSPPFITFAQGIICDPNITKIDAHASRYGPGHYLTKHVDDGEIKERRAAYTIGFSRDWQPDWGGLLMFMDENDDIRRGLVPRFNMLTVFDGLQVHSVSAISPFTPAPRLSIAGWFRDDPPFKRV